MLFEFQTTATVAAVVFAGLTVAQLFALPQRGAAPAAERTTMLDDWRTVLANRSFLSFAVAMIGSYVLSFQVYLALPLQAKLLAPHAESAIVAGVFVVSGMVAVAGQLRITRWFGSRWGPGRSLAIGMVALAVSFVPLAVIPDGSRLGTPMAIGALLVSSAMLALGSAAVFPFEMDTVVALSHNRLVATHYGFYNTIVGVGILAGNLATGSLMQAAREAGMPYLIWVALVAVGLSSALALNRLDRRGRLRPAAPDPVVAARRGR